jgi:hypothetical protein
VHRVDEAESDAEEIATTAGREVFTDELGTLGLEDGITSVRRLSRCPHGAAAAQSGEGSRR